MRKAAIPFILILAILYTAITWLNSVSVEKRTRDEIRDLASPKCFPGNRTIIKEEDISAFPEPVRRYLTLRKASGRPVTANFTVNFNGEFKMDKNGEWLKTETSQFNCAADILRIFHIKLWLNPFMTMAGRDLYRDGKGSMTGRLMRFAQVFDEKGKEFDIGELTTFLNDVLLLAPEMLIPLKEKLTWEKTGPANVRVHLRDRDLKVSADLFFDASGRLINFVTTDRFFYEAKDGQKGKLVKTKWSTPVDAYRDINGISTVSRARAVWHFSDGDFTYAKFDVAGIEINVKP